jgi:hypothetical protein
LPANLNKPITKHAAESHDKTQTSLSPYKQESTNLKLKPEQNQGAVRKNK